MDQDRPAVLMDSIIRSVIFSGRGQPVPLWSNQDSVPLSGGNMQGKQKEVAAAANGSSNQRKRKRTLYSKWQQVELESVFEVIPYPDIGTREHLAKIIRLPESKVQVWFQNRRARKNKSSKLDKTLYRRGSSLRPPHLRLSTVSTSDNYSQRDSLINMPFPPNQSGPYGHDAQQVLGLQQTGYPSFLQSSPSISQQYSGEANYNCAYKQQEPHWQNFTSSSVRPGYSCDTTLYDPKFMPLEQSKTNCPPYWDLFPYSLNENGSQTSLGYISDVIYNAAILTNLGDL
ncbi:homeobox protein SEBOX [Hyperolius riggenbachi]|uniref:homeobox protein SEBOX n=1 Tax=Hyperolius riggenbachi TaxID=752182 RepID=UPI0035A324E1